MGVRKLSATRGGRTGDVGLLGMAAAAVFLARSGDDLGVVAVAAATGGAGATNTAGGGAGAANRPGAARLSTAAFPLMTSSNCPSAARAPSTSTPYTEADAC